MSKGKKILPLSLGLSWFYFLQLLEWGKTFIGMFLNQWIKPMKQ